VLYLRQEGRGIGLYDKLDAYALQDRGLDTYDAPVRLGTAQREVRRRVRLARARRLLRGQPHRAFWSIAIEAQLYVLLPLLLLLVRRVSARAMVGLVAAIVVTIGLLGPHVPLMNSALAKFTPDLAVLFAVGLLAAGIVTAGEHTRPGHGPVTRWPPRCRPSR